MRELTMDELEEVSGAGWGDALAAFGTAAYIGNATYGASWATIGVLTAVTGSAVVATAMVGLAFFGGYQILQD